MQTTGSPTKILGTEEENEQLFINQGTFNIDFSSQNPTAVTDLKTIDQASDRTLDQIKLLTRNHQVNVKGVLTLGELPPKEVKKRNGEIGYVKENCVIELQLYTYGMTLQKHSKMVKATMLKILASKSYSGKHLVRYNSHHFLQRE